MFILAAMAFSNKRRFYKIYPCVKVQKTEIHYFKYQSPSLFQLYQVKENKRYDYDSFFVKSEDFNLNITITEVILREKSLIAI